MQMPKKENAENQWFTVKEYQWLKHYSEVKNPTIFVANNRRQDSIGDCTSESGLTETDIRNYNANSKILKLKSST
uniref:Uncharacterized protein n=1 Tax=Romanomermis culicivorax TaxID=13658 RepID=A0A915KHD1_ROMCU